MRLDNANIRIKPNKTEHAASAWLAKLDKIYGDEFHEDCIDAYAERDAAFSAWLSASPVNRVSLLRLIGVWRRVNRLRV